MNNLTVIFSVIATVGVCYLLHYWDVSHIKAANQIQVVAATTQANAECKKMENVTTGASHEYETEISNLASERYSVSVYAGPALGVPAAAAPAGYFGAPSQPGHVLADEVGRTFLYDYGAEAEKYRLQLKSCQKFIISTWAAENK